MRLHFTKMHGAGNDYVYVDGFSEAIGDPAELARAVSDRHFGVGGDGLLEAERQLGGQRHAEAARVCGREQLLGTRPPFRRADPARLVVRQRQEVVRVPAAHPGPAEMIGDPRGARALREAREGLLRRRRRTSGGHP